MLSRILLIFAVISLVKLQNLKSGIEVKSLKCEYLDSFFKDYIFPNNTCNVEVYGRKRIKVWNHYQILKKPVNEFYVRICRKKKFKIKVTVFRRKSVYFTSNVIRPIEKSSRVLNLNLADFLNLQPATFLSKLHLKL